MYWRRNSYQNQNWKQFWNGMYLLTKDVLCDEYISQHLAIQGWREVLPCNLLNFLAFSLPKSGCGPSLDLNPTWSCKKTSLCYFYGVFYFTVSFVSISGCCYTTNRSQNKPAIQAETTWKIYKEKRKKEQYWKTKKIQ